MSSQGIGAGDLWPPWVQRGLVLASRHAVAVAVGVGLLLIGVGVGLVIGRWTATGVALLGAGGAVLGNGLFGALVQTEQFRTVFQKAVAEVFYTPHATMLRAEMLPRLTALARALVRSTLSDEGRAQVVADEVATKMFGDGSAYSYQNMQMRHDIADVPGKSGYVRITSTFRASILLSTDGEPAEFRHRSIVGEGCSTLKELLIDGECISFPGSSAVQQLSKGEVRISVPLRGFTLPSGKPISNRPTIQRTLEVEHRLCDEPYCAISITRFTMGLEVVANVASGSDLAVHLKRTAKFDSSPTPKPDVRGDFRWVLCGPGGILLPGDGYVLIITHRHGESS